jgi:glucan 1,3-beta-glucosidase
MAAASPAITSEEQRPLSSATPYDSPRMVTHPPLPAGDEFDPTTLNEPRAPFLSDGSESPRNSSLRNSYAQPGTPTESGMLLANKESTGTSEEELGPTRALPEPPTRRRRSLLILIALLIIVVLLIAIIVPVYFTVIKPKTNVTTAGSSTGAASPTSSSTTHTPPKQGAFSGGDGSTVRATNGSTFTYNNKLGGICEFVVGHASIFLTFWTANRVL